MLWICFRTLPLLVLVNLLSNVKLFAKCKDGDKAYDKQFKLQRYAFKDYLKKFDPSTVYERIDRKRKIDGITISKEEEFQLMMEGIDETDELLGLAVKNGNAKIHLNKDGRRWRAQASKNEETLGFDVFDCRPRLEELMKAAIYQSRDKMIIMQDLRKKYRKSSLYKMGFLISKLDNKCKSFYKVARSAVRACTVVKYDVYLNYAHISLHVLSTNERLVGLWFEIELLVELLERNDVKCREFLGNLTTDQKIEFDFEE